MPYIMIMGGLSAPHLSKDEGATVYGLKKDERAAVVRRLASDSDPDVIVGKLDIVLSISIADVATLGLNDTKNIIVIGIGSYRVRVEELNTSLGMTAAVASDSEKTVRVAQKGLTLVVVNRLHSLLGYDVVSHSMAMTNANRELVSFTMYKKSSSNSHTHSHSGSSSHKPHSHGNVVNL